MLSRRSARRRTLAECLSGPGPDQPADRVDRRRAQVHRAPGRLAHGGRRGGGHRDAGPDGPPLAAVYQPLTQNEIGFFPGAVVIQARSAENLGPAAARLIHELIPNQPVERIATLEQICEETVAPQRLNAMLLAAFGAVALAIRAPARASVYLSLWWEGLPSADPLV